MDAALFVQMFAESLPSVIFFWGIAYYVLIKRNRISVSIPVASISLFAPAAILAMIAWPITKASYGPGMQLIAPLVLSVVSCVALYFQSKKSNISKHQNQLHGTVQAALPSGALAANSNASAPVQPNQAAAPVRPAQQSTPASHMAVQPHGAAPASIAAAPTPINEDAIYTAIALELETGTADKGLWTRAFAECSGDENQTKARYIRERAERLITAERARLEQERHEHINQEGLASSENQQARDLTPDLQAEASISAEVVEGSDYIALSEMRRFGIEQVGKQFLFQTYRYDKLSDAVAYAKHLNGEAGREAGKTTQSGTSTSEVEPSLWNDANPHRTRLLARTLESPKDCKDVLEYLGYRVVGVDSGPWIIREPRAAKVKVKSLPELVEYAIERQSMLRQKQSNGSSSHGATLSRWGSDSFN